MKFGSVRPIVWPTPEFATSPKKAEGVASIEQCAVAIRLAGTKQENVLPEIKVVGNGWISLMAYQAKGYGYIAP